ncbi:hypothetical protein [Streptomyces violascens]|uniref:hypothetical protein n=1 Tax=Streptomyces violascens TaxID=67381 RepID=UPI0036B5A45F
MRQLALKSALFAAAFAAALVPAAQAVPVSHATPVAAPAVHAVPPGQVYFWPGPDQMGDGGAWAYEPGDDHWWEGDMFKHDSSWANHGISGPGVKDHVKVYQGRELLGRVTICLAPGQEVVYDRGANDQGGSHTWTSGC